MIRTKLSRATGTALVAGSLLLSACGATGGAGSATLAGGAKNQKVEPGSFEGAKGARFLKQAASATADVKTMRERMTMTTKGGGMDLSMTAEGDYDVVNGRGHFTMSMADMGGEIEMVVDGDTVYMKIPMMAGNGKPWSKMSAADLGQAGTSTAATDPGAFLKMLEGTGAEITTIGKEDVRGVATTHISTTLDLRKLMEQAVGDDKADVEKQLDSMGGAALPAVPTEVWVDDDGYVRKLTMDMDLAEMTGGAGGSGTITVTVELYDFNEPVDIEIPDPSQVGDLGVGALGGD